MKEEEFKRLIELKKIEIGHVVKFFSSAADICSSKCITKYTDSDLTPAERACAERCVEKWFEAWKKQQAKMNPGMDNGLPLNDDLPAEEPQQQKKGWF
eukprot:gene3950-4933_t